MGFLDGLFRPAPPNALQLTVPLPHQPGLVYYDGTPAFRADPQVDPFIHAGMYAYIPGAGSVQLPKGVASSMREYYPEQDIGTPWMVSVPQLAPPGWGQFFYGLYDRQQDAMDNSASTTFDPVLSGDYVIPVNEVDDSPMYYVGGSGGV